MINFGTKMVALLGKMFNCFFLKKNFMAPFLWMGFNYLKATATSRKFTFYHSVPRNTWHSFFRPRKDERLSRPWSHPVVSSTGPLDWQSSALTTRPLLLFFKSFFFSFWPMSPFYIPTENTWFRILQYSEYARFLHM